ncbi:helix-turn-helix domain protein [Pseudomonas aeruginosa PAO581]|jgi:transposase|nr:helix-turn-helix domain protein [Pseudomonas aeruginosa PAO581]
MSMRELDRLKVIEAIIEGRLKPAAAAQRLRLTTRQVHRLVLRYREDGPAGLTSRRRGQPSNRQLSPGLENPAISLIRRNYSDFGPTLAQEKLVECHGLKLAKETVRRIMVDAGMWVPRKQRPPKVYQPRNRRACCGELIQIDDGKPLAFYSDKASVFRSNHKAPQGGDGYTQFGRAMYELNIESCANSSQAKGRVERANLTLQDRLVKELRLRGISNMADANAFAAHFMASYNARFAKPPRSEHDCHRPLHSDEDLELIFAWREARRVSQRLTVQYDKVLYLLADTPQSRRLAGDHVDDLPLPEWPHRAQGGRHRPPLYHLRQTLRDRPGCHRREQALGSCAASRPARPSAARQSALAIGTGKSAAVNARQDAVEEGAARTDAGRYRRCPG